MNPYFLKGLVSHSPQFASFNTTFRLDFVYKLIVNEIIYELSFSGAPFPANFRDVVKTIFKRLFRVYAHIYHTHFQKIVSLKEEAHLNTCFKHFILFTCVSFLQTQFCSISGFCGEMKIFFF